VTYPLEAVMKLSLTAAAITAATLFVAGVQAETYNSTTGTTEWHTATNWTPNTVPNAVGATANFPSATGTRIVTLTSAGVNTDATVGSMTFTNTSSFATTIGLATAADGHLILDAAGTGPVTITETGSGSNVDALAATMVFNDDVVVDVQYYNPSGNAAGAFRLGGPVTGSGGFTKNGPGLMTMAFTPSQSNLFKDYTGPTVINGGRVRLSSGATPRYTSSVTINSGGQLDMIQNNTYTFGSLLSSLPTVNLNGAGGFGGFPGAIRNDTNIVAILSNPVNLQSDSQINVFGTSSSTAFSASVSGPGKLIMGGGDGQGNNHGLLKLNSGNNSYSGGTSVIQGTVELTAASTNDTAPGLGTGNVVVDGFSNDTNTGIYAWGKLIIDSGADNAIKNTASLSISNGNGFGGGTVTLGAGINERIGSLFINGIKQLGGVTYGSTDSTAIFTDNTSFVSNGGANTGVLQVSVPGDFDSNGTVGASDYVLWRKSYSSNTSLYNLWAANYGGVNAGSGSGLGLNGGGVPEPSTFALFSVLGSIFAASRRRRFAMSI
jgi:fibronectin-binding autotransporter adhesin